MDRVRKGTIVIEVPTCISSGWAGLCAQLLVAGVETIYLAENCEAALAEESGPTALAEFIDGVELWEEPSSRWGTRCPEVLFLGEVPVPRRIVMGLSAAKAFPLNLRQTEHDRELETLQVLREQGKLLDTEGSPYIGGALQLVVDGCVACGVCVRACPHDALQLKVGANALEDVPSSGIGPSQMNMGLMFDASTCQGDQKCIQICPEQAITSAGPIPIMDLLGQDVRMLAEVSYAICSKCNARHHEVGESLCRSCRGRQDQGFGATANVEELIERARQYRQIHGL